MRYGSLYTNIDYYKISGLSFTLVFLLRRLIFAYAIVYAYMNVVAQSYLITYSSLLLLVYYVLN